MQKRKGISQTDVLVILIVISLVIVLGIPLAIFYKKMPRPMTRPSSRTTCATNLKGLGIAMLVYGLDYDDEFPVIGGKDASWSKTLGWDYDNISANYFYGGAENTAPRTITASWYLLVREADVSPASFVCPRSTQKEFKNKSSYDLYKLWDFGPEPYKHVSYAMQNPYGKFPVTGASNPGNAIAADMSPWFKDGDIVGPASGSVPPYPDTNTGLRADRLGNSLNHGGEGQNVLFGDGHVEFVRSPNVGVDKDNIYTYWSNEASPTDKDKQVGVNPTARDKDNDSKDAADSFLAI